MDDKNSAAFYSLGAAFINKAVQVNESLNRIDDELRANRGTLTRSEIEAGEAEMERLRDNRRAYFVRAEEPLERARILIEAAGQGAAEICRRLFRYICRQKALR